VVELAMRKISNNLLTSRFDNFKKVVKSKFRNQELTTFKKLSNLNSETKS